MKANKTIQFFEDRSLLRKIGYLKNKKNELYEQKGPGCPDYITVSVQLDVLINQYIEEKIQSLK